MRFQFLAAVVALSSLSHAVQKNLQRQDLEQRHILHERRTESQHWIKRDVLHPHVQMPMRIGLFGDNMDRGHGLLMDVADPNSKNYGKYYSAEEIYGLFAPPQKSVDAVRSWLERSGIETGRISQSTNKQWIQLDLTMWEAESLLKTKYYLFEYTPTGKMAVGCDGYHVHEDVVQHIDYITPGIKLVATTHTRKRSEVQHALRDTTEHEAALLEQAWPQINKSLTDTGPLAICDVGIAPECIRAMYNFTQATSAEPHNELGIFEDIGDYYSQADLDSFFRTLHPRIPNGTHPILHSVDGGTAPSTVAGPESNLDLQVSYPIIWPQNSVLFQTDDPVYEANYSFLGLFNNFLDAIDGSYCSSTSNGITGNTPGLDPQYPNPAPGGYKGQLQCGVYKPTNVISLSYGFQEANLPPNYLKRQCNEYMKLGMQGISVVVASGDSGVAGNAGDGSANGCLRNGTVFSPEFPSACPYVTAVGATLLTGSAKKDEETAVTRFPSGGGFSNVFYPSPDYQTSAVGTYFQTVGTQHSYYKDGDYNRNTSGVYNQNGRGYPDVSAVGDNILFFSGGIAKRKGGTSASAPIFASILTRINDERLKAGKSTVGFVNPTLYQHPHVLHDITVGSNPGCETEGFAASKGWDPVTGLGSPNYPAMLALFMAL